MHVAQTTKILRETQRNVTHNPPRPKADKQILHPCSKIPMHISLGAVQNVPTQWVLTLFPGFLNIVPLGGGGGMCILVEICENGCFRNVGSRGGGYVVTEQRMGRCTQNTHRTVWTIHYSESESSSLLPLSTRAGAPLCHCACLTFFSKSTSVHMAKNSCCEAFVGCIFGSQN